VAMLGSQVHRSPAVAIARLKINAALKKSIIENIIFWSKIYPYIHLYGLKGGIIGCSETRKKNSKSALTQKNRLDWFLVST
jgi:hypothetical protein